MVGCCGCRRLTERTKDAQAAYRKAVEVVLRQDAVHYSLDALKRFSKMSPMEVKKQALELAMVGREGLDVHNPNSRYQVKGFESELSGLAVTCYLYAAMQEMSPDADIGFDLSQEYASAKKLSQQQG